jgi:hypothetical protein
MWLLNKIIFKIKKIIHNIEFSFYFDRRCPKIHLFVISVEKTVKAFSTNAITVSAT